MVDFSLVETCPRPGKSHVHPGELLRVARGMLARRLVRPLVAQQLIWIHGKPLLNSFFGVGKGTFLEDPTSVWNGLEILRFIMALTCTNDLTKPFDGDIAALPFFGQWKIS